MTTAGEVRPLTPRQLEVLRLIQRTVERDPDRPPPSVPWLAMRLGLHHSVVQDHIAALYRKGYLRSPTPAGIFCTHAPSESSDG